MTESGVIAKTALVYGQMNEPPGARLRVGLAGLTMAEYFRDERNQDVLLFIDNIFRFVQAGSEVSALLGRMPSAVGYQPTLATEMGQLQERITSTSKGSITSVQAIYVPADDLTDPAPAASFAHLDATTVLSRAISEKGIYPAVDPLDSTSRILQPGDGRRGALPRPPPRCSRCSSATRTSRTSSPSWAWTSSPTRTRSIVQRARKIERFLSQPFHVAEPFTGTPGKYVKLEDTIRSFQEVLSGKHDDLPEQAFYLVGAHRGRRRGRREDEDRRLGAVADHPRISGRAHHAGGRRVRGRRRGAGRAGRRRRAGHPREPRAADLAAQARRDPNHRRGRRPSSGTPPTTATSRCARTAPWCSSARRSTPTRSRRREAARAARGGARGARAGRGRRRRRVRRPPGRGVRRGGRQGRPALSPAGRGLPGARPHRVPRAAVAARRRSCASSWCSRTWSSLPLLELAAVVVYLLAWFAILLTGRYPGAFFGFVAGTLRYCDPRRLLLAAPHRPVPAVRARGAHRRLPGAGVGRRARAALPAHDVPSARARDPGVADPLLPRALLGDDELRGVVGHPRDGPPAVRHVRGDGAAAIATRRGCPPTPGSSPTRTRGSRRKAVPSPVRGESRWGSSPPLNEFGRPGRTGWMSILLRPRARVGAPQEPMATQTPPTPPPSRARPKMTVYGGGRPPRKRKRRRWVRIALWSFASIFLVMLAGAGVVAYWLYGDYTRITSNSRDVQKATKDLAEPLPQADAPAIALVIGSDHRYTDGSSPSRSDTFMLVRIDPKRHLVSLLSFPRDLWVPIPGFGNDRINAAFSDGAQLQGSSPTKLALETVKNLTGLKINYVAVVDFRGFSDLVNNLDGVYVPVDEYYLHTKATNDASPIGDALLRDRREARLPAPARARRAGVQPLPPHRLRLLPKRPPADVPARLRAAGREPLPRRLDHRPARHQGAARHDLAQRPDRRARRCARACARSSSTRRSRHRSPATSCRPGSTRRPGWRARRRWSSPRRMRSTRPCTGSRIPQTLASPTGQLPTGKKPKKPKKHKFKPAVDPVDGGALGAERHDEGRRGGLDGDGPRRVRLHDLVGQRRHADATPRPGSTTDRDRRPPQADVKQILGAGQLGPLPATFSSTSADVVVVLGTDYGGQARDPPAA